MGNQPNPWWLIIISSLFLIGFTVAAFTAGSNWKRGFLFLISGTFGFLLKFGPFGFTCSFRSMLSSGDFSQMRDMFVMMFFSTLFIVLLQIKDFIPHPFFFPEKTTFGKAQEKNRRLARIGLLHVRHGNGPRIRLCNGHSCWNGRRIAQKLARHLVLHCRRYNWRVRSSL
ncbi:hypothetical protein TRFO_06722 [Tritrichomonas foetus]|uniref:Uncharacterized protein n=1 Tax=Tritrichomonas foetus TaxID=1144522 RepID=A0A1J4JXQ6_9EUKA|nr:hypothetical protein TRFO_06722 [Tritrichomonas foetus]|eukprot:OHT03466.1 hypothetical protein TRFO_06722 [Tritrichomonas foetus]